MREALKELAAEGLIEHVPYRGVRVVALSTEDIEDLYEHRTFLRRARRSSPQHITAGEIAEMKAMLAEMESLPQSRSAKYRKVNRNFHENDLSHQPPRIFDPYVDANVGGFPNHVDRQLCDDRPLPQRDPNDQTEHREIVAALKAHEGLAKP